jgi:hypothetical protein
MNSYCKFGAALWAVAALSTAAYAQGQADQAYYNQGNDLQDTYDAVLTNFQCNNGQCVDYCDSDCGCPSDCCCDTGCCDSCSSSGMMGQDRCKQFYGGVEYLYVRANFSEMVSHVTENDVDVLNTFDTFHELEFQPGHSYLTFVGCRDACCGMECRFQYTHLESRAPGIDIASQGGVGVTIAFPLEPQLNPDNTVRVFADVELDDYDLGCAKVIPLGSPMCCDTGCGDCCDCCGPCCPAWDITWEGAVRYSDVRWSQDIVSTYNPPLGGPPEGQESAAYNRMDFQGGGLRVGLGGRRYFGKQGCFSLFLNGDISLLVGDVNIETRRELQNVAPDPNVVSSQYYKMRNIIPVTELEAGVSGHLSSCLTFSAGYMLSAWHDLGMRNELFPVTAQANSGINSHDDANILGFDGFFARLEGQF